MTPTTSVSVSAAKRARPPDAPIPDSPTVFSLGPCAGQTLSLLTAAKSKLCAQKIAGPIPKAEVVPPVFLSTRVLPPTTTPGGRVAIDVTFFNATDKPITLFFATGPELREPFDDMPWARTPSVGFDTEAATAPSESGDEGESVDAMKGIAHMFLRFYPKDDTVWTRVEIAPFGSLEGRVWWRAEGYDPTRDYRPDLNAELAAGNTRGPEKEPLRVGAYDVTVSLPMVRYEHGVWAPSTVARVLVR